jgi:NADPH:quinone reductase-like Zn-dependent oxidoreductase
MLLDLTPSRFAEIKSLALTAKFILWVNMRSDGLNSASEADMQMAVGFTRVIRKENIGLRLVSLTVRQDLSDYSEILRVVDRILRISFQEKRHPTCELEYEFRDNKVLVPRLRPATNYERWMRGKNPSRGHAMTEMTEFLTPERPLKMEVGVRGVLSSIRFIDEEPRGPLGPFEVEIQARAYGVNTKDVEIAVGHTDEQPGRATSVSEWAGVITAVGSCLRRKWKVGDKVCGLSGARYSPYASNPRIGRPDTDLMRHLPSAMTYSDAASTLHAFTVAYHALVELGRLESGQSVLIHAADEAIGQAAVMISQLIGANIFVTVRDAAGSKLLLHGLQVPADHLYSSEFVTFRQGILRQTGGRGVNVILNLLDEAKFGDSWACLAQFGTFINIEGGAHKYAIAPGDKNAILASLNLGLLVRHRPEAVGKAMDKVIELFEKSQLKSISPVKCLSISDIEDAFSLASKGRTSGKLVLEINSGALVKATMPRTPDFELPADGTYVVPGGLGSLGEKICVWLANHGARHIVALTRSGMTRSSDAIMALEQQLEMLGAKLYRPACDITDEARVREVATWCKAHLPPVKGVIQSAALFKVCSSF